LDGWRSLAVMRKGEREKGRKGEREKGRRGEGEKGRRGEGEKGRRGEGEKGRRGEREKSLVIQSPFLPISPSPLLLFRRASMPGRVQQVGLLQ
jgi:hypothetical protein